MGHRYPYYQRDSLNESLKEKIWGSHYVFAGNKDVVIVELLILQEMMKKMDGPRQHTWLENSKFTLIQVYIQWVLLFKAGLLYGAHYCLPPNASNDAKFSCDGRPLPSIVLGIFINGAPSSSPAPSLLKE